MDDFESMSDRELLLYTARKLAEFQQLASDMSAVAESSPMFRAMFGKLFGGVKVR